MSTTVAILVGAGLAVTAFLIGRLYQWIRDARQVMGGATERGRKWTR